MQPSNFFARCSETFRRNARAAALASLWNMDSAFSYLRPVESTLKQPG